MKSSRYINLKNIFKLSIKRHIYILQHASKFHENLDSPLHLFYKISLRDPPCFFNPLELTFSAWFRILLDLLIIFRIYVIDLKSRDIWEISPWSWLILAYFGIFAILSQNSRNFRFFKVVRFWSLTAQTNRLFTLISKIVVIYWI